MTKQEFATWAISRGYTQDKFGHYQKAMDGKQYRYKIQAQSIRREVQVTHEDGKHDWVRITSGYLSKLTVNDKNQLVIK
jgi:hypothetical protein